MTWKRPAYWSYMTRGERVLWVIAILVTWPTFGTYDVAHRGLVAIKQRHRSR